MIIIYECKGGEMTKAATFSISIREISTGAQLAVFSLRQWQIDRGDRDALKTVLAPFYKRLNVEVALEAFLSLIDQLDRYGDDPLVFHCPCQESLHDNERRFLDWLLLDDAHDFLEGALKKSRKSSRIARLMGERFSKTLFLRGLSIALPQRTDGTRSGSESSLLKVRA
jgi:hypothetical protein